MTPLTIQEQVLIASAPLLINHHDDPRRLAHPLQPCLSPTETSGRDQRLVWLHPSICCSSFHRPISPPSQDKAALNMLPCMQVLWYLHSLVVTMRLFGPTPTVSPVAAVSTKKGSRTPDHSVQCSQRAEKPADEHRHALGLARDSAGPTSTKVGTEQTNTRLRGRSHPDHPAHPEER